MAAILETAAILDLKVAEMDSLGQTTLKSIYCTTLYVNWQGNYTVCYILVFFLEAILFFSWFEGQNVIFQLGNSNFWIQQVQITLKTLVAKN